MRHPLSNFVAALGLALIGFFISEQKGEAGGFSYEQIGYGIIATAILGVFVVSARYKSFAAALGYAWNPTGTVVDLVRSWKVEGCKTHKQYQKSLADHLATKLPDMKITQESGGSRIRADIEIEKDVVIELKPNFDSTSKLQQLIGQIELYKREFRGRMILVVLVGDTERNTFQSLEEAIGLEERVRIIKK